MRNRRQSGAYTGSRDSRLTAVEMTCSREASLTEANDSGFKIVLSTCPNQMEAEQIAHSLVESQLAACVNLLPGALSVYRWEGKVESAQEVLLAIKTSAANVDEVQRSIARLHSYAVPEFVVLDIAGASRGYAEWLAASLK